MLTYNNNLGKQSDWLSVRSEHGFLIYSAGQGLKEKKLGHADVVRLFWEDLCLSCHLCNSHQSSVVHAHSGSQKYMHSTTPGHLP